MVLRLACLLCLAVFSLVGVGCTSDSASTMGDPINKPEVTYKGLAGQTCAIMVGTDWRTRTEYSNIQIDLARMLQERLAGTPAKDSKDSKDAKKPPMQFINPASVVRYQREHPELDGMPAVQLAPRLQVARVIYIEIEEFTAQSPESIMVLKGSAKATLRVVEVVGGKGTVPFEESGIHTRYPPDAPEGVVASDKYNPRSIYLGTLQRLADHLAARFEEK